MSLISGTYAVKLLGTSRSLEVARTTATGRRGLAGLELPLTRHPSCGEVDGALSHLVQIPMETTSYAIRQNNTLRSECFAIL